MSETSTSSGYSKKTTALIAGVVSVLTYLFCESGIFTGF